MFLFKCGWEESSCVNISNNHTYSNVLARLKKTRLEKQIQGVVSVQKEKRRKHQHWKEQRIKFIEKKNDVLITDLETIFFLWFILVLHTSVIVICETKMCVLKEYDLAFGYFFPLPIPRHKTRIEALNCCLIPTLH